MSRPTAIAAKRKVLGFSTMPDPSPPEPLPADGALDAAMAVLARELVSDIHPASEVLARHGFNGADDPAWLRLAANPGFQALLATLAKEWHGIDSSQKRVRAKALASVELAIPEWHRQMVDPGCPGGVRADLSKLMVAVAGVGTPTPGSGGSAEAASGFRLNIVINPPGQPSQTVTLATTPVLDARAEATD